MGDSTQRTWDDMVLVGRIARPHGLRGHVVVNPVTDFVAERFGVGSILWMRPASGERTVTITSTRLQGGRPIVQFEGFDNIGAVEPLAGLELRVPEEQLAELVAGTFYHHDLAGCRVETIDGRQVGEVARV